MDPVVAFGLASMLHAGFQVTVTALVYPVLARRTAEVWPEVHDRHSRSIAPVVLVVYGALVVTGGLLVASGPDLLEWLALAGAGAALAVTATAAAPLHGRLGVRDEALVSRLMVVDRVRCAAAVIGAVLAAAALW